MNVQIKKLSPTAIMPYKAHASDAGFDLFADEDVTIQYGDTVAVQTNIAIEIPEGFVGDIRPRSGRTLKTPLRVHYGTIDAGYRDSIGIICENASHKNMVMMKASYPIHIERGDKIAQLVIQKLPEIDLVETTELNDSDRGFNGYGSSDNQASLSDN